VLLAQQPGVTTDPAVAGYVRRALGAADSDAVAALLRAVAEDAGWDIAALHHAIWRFESARPEQRGLPSTA
jgi:hypothetical protein